MKNYSFFTNYSLLSFATNFFIVIYAIITLVDLLLKFRKPWTVKLIFSLLVLSIGISNLFQLFELNYFAGSARILELSLPRLIPRFFFQSQAEIPW